MEWRGAAKRARDASAVYLTVVLLMWVSHRLVARNGVWIPAASIGLLLIAGRVLALWKYRHQADGDDTRATILAVGALLAAGVLAVLVIMAFGEEDLAAVCLGALLALYAWSVLFYRRRVLSRSDLEWARKIAQDRLEETGDSTEHGQRLRNLVAGIDEQVRRWEP